VGWVWGGGWLVATFPMGGTIEKSLVIASTAFVLGPISGFFASESRSTLRAAITGILVFVA